MQIEFDKVTFQYHSLITEPHVALNDISFKIQSGEIVAIAGASGSGKTTLLQHINGLLRSTKGHVIVEDYDLSDPYINLHMIRRHVGVVFQFPEIQLFEETVQDDVAFGPKNLGWPDSRIKQQVINAFELVGLEFQRFGSIHPFQLSGGEKRRVAIAGVLAMDPSVLVLDEPTAGLDWQGTQKIESIIREYHKIGRTVLFVSHDMDLVARLAERVLVLDRGELIFDGKKSDLFHQTALLKKAGLDLPYIVRAIEKLGLKGIHLKGDIFSLEEAEKEITACQGGKKESITKNQG